MKKVLFTLVLLFIFAVPASADAYQNQFDSSGVAGLQQSLPESAEQILDELGVDLSDSGWVGSINTGNIFKIIKNFISEGGRAPLKAGLAIMSLIIMVAAFGLFSAGEQKTPMIGYVSTLSISAVALVPVFSVITSTSHAIKAGAQFMLSFVPVYATVLFSSGKPLTSAASSGLLLAASEGIVQLASYVITPLVGSYLAVCITGSVSSLLNNSGIAEFLKKAASWTLGLIMTVYLGVLTVQSTVNAAADSLALKTGRFLLGSFIPVVGGTLSEALTTLQSSVSLLRSSLWIYGVVVLALTALPVIIELLLWRAVLLLCSSVSTLFGESRVAGLLKAADAAVSFLVGILLICSMAFIISLAVLAATGG